MTHCSLCDSDFYVRLDRDLLSGGEPVTFHGEWDPEEPEAWEMFTVMLHGKEAGDIVPATLEDLRRVLAEFSPEELAEIRRLAGNEWSKVHHIKGETAVPSGPPDRTAADVGTDRGEDTVSNLYDRAVIDWANDQLKRQDLPPDAVALRFGDWIGCWSSWTCDYEVEATIERENGETVDVPDWGFPDVIKALPQYVAAREQLAETHAAYHGWTDNDDDTEIRFS